MTFHAITGDGRAIDPNDGIVPVLKELEPGRLKVVGTAFYVTRYGLFVSAGHVLEDLADPARTKIGTAFVLHMGNPGEAHLRRIRSVSMLAEIDIGVGLAEHYADRFPNAPLMNLRASLSTITPTPEEALLSYGYPENETLDFTVDPASNVVRADFYPGKFLRSVPAGEKPFTPYPSFETTIRVRSGASGGPVFNARGKVVGVNSRGWDFGDVPPDENLSTIVPIAHILSLQVGSLDVPAISAEHRTLAAHPRRDRPYFSDLADCGHVAIDE